MVLRAPDPVGTVPAGPYVLVGTTDLQFEVVRLIEVGQGQFEATDETYTIPVEQAEHFFPLLKSDGIVR